MAYKYAAQNVDPETTSKAAAREIPVKPKFAVNVCKAIKGRSVKQARSFLERVTRLEEPVPFRVHKRQVKHRKGGVGPGQYPVNVARAALRVLNDAASNAEYKGLDPDNMVVWHACAHRGAPMPGIMPRAQGRATAWDKSTSHIEIVLKNKEDEKPEAKGEKKADKKEE
jgi:large subunit ribosomal protein L22